MMSESILEKREDPESREVTINNNVVVIGIIERNFKYSHQVIKKNRVKKFYETRMLIKRKSETVDKVPLVVSEKLMNEKFKKKAENQYVKVVGQLRTHNELGEDGKTHLKIFVFAQEIKTLDEKEGNFNSVHLRGYICKEPIYRETPLGKRITDFLIAVNRDYGNSDYIPCIAWNDVAMWVAILEVGDEVELYGRFQSREYLKKSIDSEEREVRETYEISTLNVKKK